MQRALAGLLTGLGLLACGCPPENFDHLVIPTQEEITDVLGDDTLTVQEQRVALEDLGLTPSTINFLLRGERLGNQFGGDLRSAFTKVTSARLNELTPDEIQVYSDEASGLDDADDLDFDVTDLEAQATADFFRDIGVTTPESLEAYLDTEGAVVPDDVPADLPRDVFVDFDPTRLIPILPD